MTANGRRQVSFCGVVMVADNEIQADGARVKRFIGRANAAVHGDDQFDAVCFEFIQCVVVETVAFFKTIWNVAAHICI